MIHMGICQKKYHTLPPAAHTYPNHWNLPEPPERLPPRCTTHIALAVSSKSLLSFSFAPYVCVCVSLSPLFCLADYRQQQCAGPDTFALLCLLSTVGVKDLPSHKAPLLDARMDCTHKCHIQSSHTHKLHAHTALEIIQKMSLKHHTTLWLVSWPQMYNFEASAPIMGEKQGRF